MDDSKLIMVDPPGEGRSPDVVANELVTMIKQEFKYTILSLTHLFRCDRQWVEDFIVPNVKHIKIQFFFLTYIIENCAGRLTEDEIAMMRRGHYFVSDTDLNRFWSETAEAYKKTEMIPVSSLLQNPRHIGLLRDEYDKHRSTPASKQEKLRHLERMKDLLTDKGYSLYTDSYNANSFEWTKTAVPSLPSATPQITTSAQYAAEHQISHSLARSKLASSGATKIVLGGKTLWLTGQAPKEWSIPIRAKSLPK